MEEVKKEVTQEVKTPQAQNEPQVKEVAPVVNESPEAIQDRNWRQFRENRDKERKEAEANARRAQEKEAEAQALKAALEAALNKPQYQNQPSYDQSEDTEEQRIEKKVAEAIAKHTAQVERSRAEQEAQEFPKKLESTFKDFNNVCSAENLDYLEYHHPELARSLGARGQSFEKWADIYNAIKRYVPNTESKRDMNKAEKNLNKPQSISSPGMSQTGNAGQSSQLSKERKAENWARMQKERKSV